MKSMDLYNDSKKHKTEAEYTLRNENQIFLSNLQLQLAQRFASGEISRDVYLQIINTIFKDTFLFKESEDY